MLGAAALLLLASPVLLLAVVMVKLSGRGPLLFSQMRMGKGNRPFRMYKFRTMRAGSEDDQNFLQNVRYETGPVFKAPEDPRLTWCGRFLRRSSIDELPQLWNVLRGDMSLVGPRPLWTVEAEKASGVACLRTTVRPGLTCLWQISGRSELTYEQWILLDLFYLTHRSLVLDLLILVQTAPAVLSTHGAY
jgi:lipopolysaccharide/colanic/teichoic acid biosynthesis glycosyltransferase